MRANVRRLFEEFINLSEEDQKEFLDLLGPSLDLRKAKTAKAGRLLNLELREAAKTEEATKGKRGGWGMKCVHYRDTDGIGRTIATGWCAVADDSEPNNIKTACGLFVVCSYTGHRAPTCKECKKTLSAKKKR